MLPCGSGYLARQKEAGDGKAGQTGAATYRNCKPIRGAGAGAGSPADSVPVVPGLWPDDKRRLVCRGGAGGGAGGSGTGAGSHGRGVPEGAGGGRTAAVVQRHPRTAHLELRG